MNKLNIVGIGPGDIGYILPEAYKVLKDSDVLIGGERNLSLVKNLNKKTIVISSDLDSIVEYISDNLQNEKISVVVSGDPGYYSLLPFLKKYFKSESLNVIPGISSLQYFCAKIGLSWEDACLVSLHGREVDIVKIAKENPKCIFLTDKKNNPVEIAKKLFIAGLGERKMFVGSNLSYRNEKIIAGSISDIAGLIDLFELSITAVLNE